MTARRFADLFKEAEKHLDYWVAGAEIEFTEELARVMAEKGVSRAELARRISTSPAYITKVLRGNANFTLATMVKLGRALDVELKLHLAPRHARTVWMDECAPPLRATATAEKPQVRTVGGAWQRLAPVQTTKEKGATDGAATAAA